MTIDTYEKTRRYEVENKQAAVKLFADDLGFFQFLYDQNLEITNWLSSNKKIASSREAFVLNRLHKAQRFLFTCHNLVLAGQCNEANIIMRNVIELLLSAVDIKLHDRAWGEAKMVKYSLNDCFDRIKSDAYLDRYHQLISEHGKLSGFWSHESLKTDRIESHPTKYENGELSVRQELSVGYSHANPRLWLYFADVIKFTREITQTVDFLFEGVLQKERAKEWVETKQRFEQFLKREREFKKRHNWKN